MIIIAYGKKSREETTREAISSPNDIDLDYDIAIKQVNQKIEKKYKCTTCGSSWDSQKGHFSMSKSLIYQANNGYITMCNNCRDEYFRQLCILYKGNETKAIRHMCMQFGWFFHEDAVVASRQISSDRSRISHYLAKKNLGQTSSIGVTDIDTVKYEFSTKQDEVITSREQAKSEESTISASAVDRWGVGFTEMDYRLMDDHYRLLKRQNPNCDANQEIFIKSLCSLSMLQANALRDGDSDKYVKLTEQYAKTFKQAGLRTVEEKDNSSDECLGVTLAAISQYTPEEYYKNKDLYRDFDNIGDYFDRFVKRPLKNLMFGTNERDREYYVKDNGDIDD